MQRITVINMKGGCGKTTISTNLASAYARQGLKTTLIDYDPQASSTWWLKDRPEDAATIAGIRANETVSRVTSSWKMRLAGDTQRVIVDTPAGMKGFGLMDKLRGAHTIVIPVLPSSIDTRATADFIRDLYLVAKVDQRKTNLCIICNRVKTNTKAYRSLQRFLDVMNIPIIAELRETQSYVNAAELGLGVHEMEGADKREIETWQKITDWLDRQDEQRSSSLRYDRAS